MHSYATSSSWSNRLLLALLLTASWPVAAGGQQPAAPQAKPGQPGQSSEQPQQAQPQQAQQEPQQAQPQPKPAQPKPKPKPPRPRPRPRRPLTLFNGRDLTSWKVLNEEDFARHGEVAVRDGAIQLGKGRPATGIVYAGPPPRMNYEITLEARRTAGDDFFCGLTFPVRKQHCTLILGGWGGSVTGLSNVDNASAAENETSSFVEFKNDRWYKIRLRVTPSRIEAWVDGEQIIDLDARRRKFAVWWEQEPARPLGIATWNTAGAVRGIKLQLLNAN